MASRTQQKKIISFRYVKPILLSISAKLYYYFSAGNNYEYYVLCGMFNNRDSFKTRFETATIPTT